MATIRYSSWNEMNNKRDEIHRSYIRQYGNGFELVKYSKWNDDLYVAHCADKEATLEELIDTLQRRGYNTNEMDVCMYKEER